MAAIFPASLPWFTRFVMTPAGQRSATQPPKHYAARSNTTSAWARAEVSWVFFEEHRAAFEDWFRNDLNRGASWALMKLPITPGGIAGSCYSAVRFPSGYSKTLAINGLWRVSAQIVIRDRFECAVPPPREAVAFTSGVGTSPVKPSGVQVGDALLLIVVRHASGVFGGPAGWHDIVEGQDSSSGLRVNLVGRIADGSATDAAAAFTTGSASAWCMAAIADPADPNFPAALTGSGTDYRFVVGTNPGSVTKPGGTSQVAIAVGFILTGGSGTASLDDVPAGYTAAAAEGFSYSVASTPFDGSMLVGYRIVSGTSEDPGEFDDGSGSYGTGGNGVATVLITNG
jgi:hypothetical protein